MAGGGEATVASGAQGPGQGSGPTPRLPEGAIVDSNRVRARVDDCHGGTGPTVADGTTSAAVTTLGDSVPPRAAASPPASPPPPSPPVAWGAPLPPGVRVPEDDGGDHPPQQSTRPRGGGKAAEDAAAGTAAPSGAGDAVIALAGQSWLPSAPHQPGGPPVWPPRVTDWSTPQTRRPTEHETRDDHRGTSARPEGNQSYREQHPRPAHYPYPSVQGDRAQTPSPTVAAAAPQSFPPVPSLTSQHVTGATKEQAVVAQVRHVHTVCHI